MERRFGEMAHYGGLFSTKNPHIKGYYTALLRSIWKVSGLALVFYDRQANMKQAIIRVILIR